MNLLRTLGAHHVIDYTQENFTKAGQRYDLIFDVVRNHSFLARRRVLNPEGIYVGAGVLGQGGSMLALLAGQIGELVLSRFVSQKFLTFMAKLKQEDLTILGQLMEAGKVTPVIDRCYKLSKAPEAIRYLEEKPRSRKSRHNSGNTDPAAIPSWQEAYNHLIAEGQLSRVEHPSEAHQVRRYDPPGFESRMTQELRPVSAAKAIGSSAKQ